jgi:hypothetical protein
MLGVVTMKRQIDHDFPILEQAFTEADEAFRKDTSVIFGSEGEKAQKLFDQLRRNWKIWETPGQCMYRGCNQPSIRRSHSIQKVGHLERIAESQHVLTPRIDTHGKLGMKRIGVNLASTFPGFCERHETLFSEFEVHSSVSTPRHVALQAFRTLCREIFRVRNEVAGLDTWIDQYRRARSNHYIAAVHKAAPYAKVQGVEVKGDGVEQFMVTKLKSTKHVLSELERELYVELFEYISDEKREPCLKIISLPFEVPVACSGFGNLTYKQDGKRREAFCPLGILPQDGSTIAYFVTAWKHSRISGFYFDLMCAGFGALNAMESWLVNGSDHWFIRPSAWLSIPPARQTKILEQIMSDDENIGSFLKFSILDDARRKIITWVTEGFDNVEDKDRPKISEMVRIESAKLSN